MIYIHIYRIWGNHNAALEHAHVDHNDHNDDNDNDEDYEPE